VSTRGVALRIVPAGDEAVLVELGRNMDEAVNRRVHALARSLAKVAPRWLQETVPADGSLLIYYDPDQISYQQLSSRLQQLAGEVEDAPALEGRLWEIPVRYGGNDGPDLEWVAKRVGKTADEVVALHSAPVYTVYILGFTPGFCYLGELPASLAVERMSTPRLRLPAGAVAIAGRQTGVYSLKDSPGGWRWIGRTDLTLWDPFRAQPFLLQPGDRVRLVPT